MRVLGRYAVIAVLSIVFVHPAQGGVRAQMKVQGDGTSNSIRLMHPFTQFNPDALIVVSEFGWYEPGSLNVYYSGDWFLGNNGGSPIPTEAVFWLLMFDTDSGFRHLTTNSNINGRFTILDHPLLNNDPDARPIATREGTNSQSPWPYGVYYNSTLARWTIFVQDDSHTIPVNASFSVFIPDAEDLTFTHTANAGNITSNYTSLDNPVLDHTLPHRIFATQRFAGAFNDEEVAVSWVSSFVIGNADGTAMPAGAGFNVFVAPIFEDGFEMGSTVLWSGEAP